MCGRRLMHLIRDVGCQNPGHARNASWMLCLLIILVRIAGLCLDNPSFMMMRSLSAVIQSSSGWSLHRTTGPFFPPFLSLPLALPLPLPLASLPWPFSCAPAVLRTEHTLPVTLPGAPALQPWSPQPGSVAVERTRLCVFHRSSSSEETTTGELSFTGLSFSELTADCSKEPELQSPK